MKFPTGGKVRERFKETQNRFDSGTDSTVWMKESEEIPMRKVNTRQLVLLGMFAAIAYVLMAVGRVPVVLFLSYEPKDVIFAVCGFLFGPLAAFGVALVVCLVEMFTVSTTGVIGLIMNLLSSCAFACTASAIYKHKRTLPGAILGLILGSILMVGVMLLWNWLITPMYMQIERSVVEAMLVPIFLPFNGLKAGLNTALTLGLYKPLTTALRTLRLVHSGENTQKGRSIGVYLLSALLLVTCLLLLLVFMGVL